MSIFFTFCSISKIFCPTCVLFVKHPKLQGQRGVEQLFLNFVEQYVGKDRLILLIPVCSDIHWHLIKVDFTRGDWPLLLSSSQEEVLAIASKIIKCRENGRNKKNHLSSTSPTASWDLSNNRTYVNFFL